MSDGNGGSEPKIAPGLEHLRTDLERVHPDPDNPNVHPLESIRALKHSMEEHGQDQPIVAREVDGRIIKGNGRYTAARQLGWAEAAVLWVDEGELEAIRRGLADHGSERLGFLEDGALHEALEVAGHDDEPVAGFDPKVLERIREAVAGGAGEDERGMTPEERAERRQDTDYREIVLYVLYEDYQRLEPRLERAREEAGVERNAELYTIMADEWTDGHPDVEVMPDADD